MKLIITAALIVLSLFLLVDLVHGVTASFQCTVTILPPPVTMETQKSMADYFSPNFQPRVAVIPAAQPVETVFWDVLRTETADGVLMTYLSK